MMKKNFLLAGGLALSAALTGCGGSSSGSSSSQTFSVEGLTAVEGSTSLAGIWVGTTAYVETDTGSYMTESGDEIAYEDTYTGSRAVIYNITGNETDGFDFIDCNGNSSSVSYEPATATVSVDGRVLQMTNFNQMTGTSTEAEWGSVGQENWTWVKVANTGDNIGAISFAETYGNVELLSLCRESYVLTSTDGEGWTTVMDKGAHTASGQSSPEYFRVRLDSDGFASAYFEVATENFTDEIGTISLTASNDSVDNYQASYSVSKPSVSINANLTVSLD